MGGKHIKAAHNHSLHFATPYGVAGRRYAAPMSSTLCAFRLFVSSPSVAFCFIMFRDRICYRVSTRAIPSPSSVKPMHAVRNRPTTALAYPSALRLGGIAGVVFPKTGPAHGRSLCTWLPD